MPRIAWLTDIHLNFVQPQSGVTDFLETVRVENPDAVLISGDIGEAPNIVKYLQVIDQTLQLPVYFVLGNHDFYRGGIASTRHKVSKLCLARPNLHYLTLATDPIALSPRMGLIGHDSWADGRAGDYDNSTAMLNDYLVIREFAGLTPELRKDRMRVFGDEAAQHIRKQLDDAMQRFDHVMLLTHVPPFRELCYHKGELLDDNWAPHFCCLGVGEAIVEVMRDYPKRRVTVLCGHLHSSSQHNPLPNVSVMIGGAEYGKPAIVRVFTLPD
ncbi:MAG: metallophosphoesterase [Pirellulaceae bacterium]|nr:metallophosphoesterase [Pirellulaceae bacterium]